MQKDWEEQSRQKLMFNVSLSTVLIGSQHMIKTATSVVKSNEIKDKHVIGFAFMMIRAALACHRKDKASRTWF